MTDSLGLTLGIVLLSLAGLILCAEIAVKKILSLAAHIGFSSTFVGLTLFSVVTSLPEIFSHLIASAEIIAGKLDYQITSATVSGANIGSDVVPQALFSG